MTLPKQPTTILALPIPVQPESAIIWPGLAGCSDALSIALAIQQQECLFVIVTEDTQSALRLEHELAFFLIAEYPISAFS